MFEAQFWIDTDREVAGAPRSPWRANPMGGELLVAVRPKALVASYQVLIVNVVVSRGDTETRFSQTCNRFRLRVQMNNRLAELPVTVVLSSVPHLVLIENTCCNSELGKARSQHKIGKRS